MIASKAEFNALSRAGRIGNYLRSWDTVEAMRASGYRGFATIRCRQAGSGWFVPYAGGMEIEKRLAAIRAQGGPGPEAFYFQEVPDPGTRRVANLEAMLTERGVFMYIERDTTTPVRGIRERGACIDGGLRAQALLRSLLSPGSYDTLQEIWSEHPTSIIEATEWAAPCGAFHQPLVIWECRDY